MENAVSHCNSLGAVGDNYGHTCRQGTGLWLGGEECPSRLGNYNFLDLFGTQETDGVTGATPLPKTAH